MAVSVLGAPILVGREIQSSRFFSTPEFSSCARLHFIRLSTYTCRIEIQTCYSIVGFRILRFFFNAGSLTILIESNNTESLRVWNVIAKHGSTVVFLSINYSCFQNLTEAITVENVVTKNPLQSALSDPLYF